MRVSVKTFPFEVQDQLAIDGKAHPATVTARESGVRGLVIHRPIREDAKLSAWVLTHGPTGCVVARLRTLRQCRACAARLDATIGWERMLTWEVDLETGRLTNALPGENKVAAAAVAYAKSL